MRKTAIFFLILLLPFRIFLVNSASDEGYGEANENLGQFTDSFENEDNVSIAVNVINNQTLECMELNYTVGVSIYANFTEYTEVDEDNDITITNDKIEWDSLRRDADSYVYKDYGVDYFENFNHNFTLVFSDIEAGGGISRDVMDIYRIGNGYGAMGDYNGISGDFIRVLIKQNGPIDDEFYYRFQQFTGGLQDFIDDSIVYNIGTHYITIERVGIAVSCKIYSDAERTVLLEELGGSGDNTKYRYLQPLTGREQGTDPADHSSGYIEYLLLESSSSGYPSDGYFITENYLNYTTGNSLTLLTNASIPEGTTMTVEFSEDNSTWVLNDWDPIFGGFEAIDLRDLNYSQCYTRYNFTGTPLFTPRLYQSRLVTTNGTAGGAPGPGITVVESDAPWVALAIILSIIALLLAWGSKR